MIGEQVGEAKGAQEGGEGRQSCEDATAEDEPRGYLECENR